MNARLLAYQILSGVFLERQYANLLLRQKLTDVNDLDKSLVTQIVYGTIQYQRYLRFQYQDFVKHKLDERTLILLDMSVYQMVFLDKVPAYAAVNEAVDISKQFHTSAIVNGILRNFLRRGVLACDNIAIAYSFPDWIVKLFVSQYGREVAVDILKASNQSSRVMLRYNRLKVLKEDLLKDSNFSEGNSTDEVVYRGNILTTDYFKKGEVIIQDSSSQEVALVLDPKSGDKVLDVCAAPGTKTSHIAGLMNNQGEIIALDINRTRLDLLEKSLTRLGVECVKTMVLDAKLTNKNFEANSFDRILVDAPCSGLGVLKRKPEIKYFVTPKSMDELVTLQKEILAGVVGLLKIGGRLVYSTCTLNQKENQKQIANFIETYPEYQLETEKVIFPDEKNGDGFYIASLIRVK